jgi:dTMP kinase
MGGKDPKGSLNGAEVEPVQLGLPDPIQAPACHRWRAQVQGILGRERDIRELKEAGQAGRFDLLSRNGRKEGEEEHCEYSGNHDNAALLDYAVICGFRQSPIGELLVSGTAATFERFIVLEGLDGAGTTTQLKLAAEKLGERHLPHYCTSEPTTGPLGRIIRDILSHRLKTHPRTLALLFAADRTEHLHEPGTGMLDRLKRGELVICDRYLFSSMAYQSLDCDFEFVYALNREFALPRHLVFLDTPIELSQSRLAARSAGDPELFETLGVQSRILANYGRAFELYREAGMQLHRIDGSLPAGEVFWKFWKIIESVPML